MSAKSPYLYVTAEVDGHKITIAKRNLECEEDDAGLAWFDFESENSIAQSTGTLLWDASFAVVQLLKQADHPLRGLVTGKRVLELGSGTGLAGLCCAAAGAHMLCSDLASIVDGILMRNINHNVEAAAAAVQAKGPDAAVADAAGPSSQEQGSGTTVPTPGSRQCGWHGSKPLYAGSIASMAVDFCRPLDKQVAGGNDPRDAEVVLAIDIVWLRELVEPLVCTMSDILHHPTPSSTASVTATPSATVTAPAVTQTAATDTSAAGSLPPSGSELASSTAGAAPANGKVGLLAFGERAQEGSKMFVPLEELCAVFHARGCATELLGRLVVEKEPGEKMPVAVLKVWAV